MTYSIQNHLLYQNGAPVRFEVIPNYSKTTKIVSCEYLVLHFTGAVGVEPVVNYFKNPAAQVSAHLLIGRGGEVVQFIPFDTVAWHAGGSSWACRTGLNYYSIGIELDNGGNLEYKNGQYYSGNTLIPWDDTMTARHKLEYATRTWHTYTQEQYSACAEIAAILNTAYGFIDIVGHDDISTYGKIDPGPAFDIDAIKTPILGADNMFTLCTSLYLRSGAGSNYPYTGTYQYSGTKYRLKEYSMGWVRVTDAGWVEKRKLRRDPVTVTNIYLPAIMR